MADFTIDPQAPVSRDDVRAYLTRQAPPWQILAENLDTGRTAGIDFVALDAAGDLVVVLVGQAGEDLELLTLGLAQASWVESQVPTWRQLAPTLALGPATRVRALLVGPDFGEEARAAARRLGSQIELLRARGVRNGVQGGLLFETLVAPGPRPETEEPSAASPPDLDFRSGLTAEDLRLTAEEQREFE